MTMKPTLRLHPDSYAYRDINAKYAHGAPLTPDQLNFIYENQNHLMFFSHQMNEVVKYYLKQYKKNGLENSNKKFDRASIEQFKRHLTSLLGERNSQVQIKMKPEQFLQMRALTTDELILYHGNQFLTGAPFYYGGQPHTLFFQWGNLFGVAKYVVLAEEKALKSNLLIHFEGMHERFLEQCVHEYRDHMLALGHEMPASHPIPQPIPTYQTPRLTLSINGGKEQEVK